MYEQLNKNIYLIYLKLANFSNIFLEFHSILTPEKHSGLVEKMGSSLEHEDKRIGRVHI